MSSIDSRRIFSRNENPFDRKGSYILYWMQTNRRFHFNYALEYAIELANELKRPLLIYEAITCNHPWASDRFHYFALEGMAENLSYARKNNLNYVCYTEQRPGAARDLLLRLTENASAVVSDEYPVLMPRKRNERLSEEVAVPYITIDSNGIIPLGITEKAPYNAYFFRKVMQRNFVDCFTTPPQKEPIRDLQNIEHIKLDNVVSDAFHETIAHLNTPASFIKTLPINHSIPKVNINGTRKAALERLHGFAGSGLWKYAKHRNNPDDEAVSKLSPWLHYGKISVYEIVEFLLNHQPEEWSLEKITYNRGSAGGFFNGDFNIDSFLDQLITWREVGFHFCHHTQDFDQYDTLPDWALKSLEKHKGDPRPYTYDLKELAEARTHDRLWNAAQTQLLREGIIHNYMRMLWGKKVIEWTPNPEIALAYLIELNNRYALDGRDPNSYSGIFWCFGRFDRAWQERAIFGKVRYMTSKSAQRKLNLDNYLKEFSNHRDK